MNKKDTTVHSSMDNASDKKKNLPWWKTRASMITARVMAAITAVILLVWFFAVHPYVRTDDARVAADIIRIANRGVNGQIEKVNAAEGGVVAPGMVLVELDRRASEAQYKKAQARAMFTATELKRMETLAAQNGASRQQLDRARSEALTAEGDLRLAELAVEYTT